MAPSVNLADEVAATQLLVAQIARKLMAQTSASRLPQAAAAAGLSVGQAQQFLGGLTVLPPHQGVTFMSALLELQRVTEASYAMRTRQGHAGSDMHFGGQETTTEGAQAAAEKLRKDYPAWRIPLPDGAEQLGTDKPVRLVWTAKHITGDWPDIHGASVGELAHKIGQVQASMKAEADAQARYADGRGLTGRATSRKG